MKNTVLIEAEKQPTYEPDLSVPGIVVTPIPVMVKEKAKRQPKPKTHDKGE